MRDIASEIKQSANMSSGVIRRKVQGLGGLHQPLVRGLNRLVIWGLTHTHTVVRRGKLEICEINIRGLENAS